MKSFIAGLLLSAGLVAAVPTDTTYTFTPFTCPNSAFMIQGTTLYSMDLPSSSLTQIESGFGLASTVNLNCLGYNVNDNYLYATTDSNRVVRLSANNQYQTVAVIPPTSDGSNWGAGDVDDSNQYWLFAGNFQYMQIDTYYNSYIGSAQVSSPIAINDWSFLSGGGRALWSVNLNSASNAVLLVRFDMASKTVTTAQTYSLLTGNSGSNFNAMFAYSATVLEALDSTTNQVWRFDITGATAPVQVASFVGSNLSRDNARCINGAVSSSSSTTTTTTTIVPTTTTTTTVPTTTTTTTVPTTTTTTTVPTTTATRAATTTTTTVPTTTTTTTVPTTTTTRAATTTTTSAGPSVTARYDGCYTDSYPIGRTLNDFPRFVSSIMTPLLCQQYCSQYGAALFGVEYSSECYCGNSLLGGAVPAPASDCSYTCSGDATQTCGGSNRLNIYGIIPAASSSTTTSSTTRSTVATTTTSAGPKVTAQAAGCYTDPFLTTSRTLGDFPRLVSSSMTPLVCQQYCSQYNAALFGVEYGVECYCGNSIGGGAVPAPTSDCNTACGGDSTQLCGGGNRVFVYGSVPAVSSTTTSSRTTSSSTSASAGPSVTARYDGCYTDIYPIGRALNDFPRLVSSSMTPLVCQTYCAQYGAALFGVEYNSECYCGNSLLGGSVPAPASDCSYACSGDATQNCGGSNRLNIYGVLPATSSSTTTSSSRTTSSSTSAGAGPSVTAVYDGCYTDIYPIGRTLNDFPRLVSSSMTPLVCQTYCAQYGAALFGVEYNSECYCGNSLLGGSVPAPASDCNYACSGDATQNCGGSNRLNIYGVIPAASSTTATATATSSTTRSSTAAATTSTTSALPTPTAQLKGCYTDNYPTARTLDDFPRLVSNSMTPYVCQQYCAQYNAAFFGVEYSTECYCGNSLLGGSVPAPVSDCNFSCSGDSSQICGGNNRLNIYGKPAVGGGTTSSTGTTTTPITTTVPTTTTARPSTTTTTTPVIITTSSSTTSSTTTSSTTTSSTTTSSTTISSTTTSSTTTSSTTTSSTTTRPSTTTTTTPVVITTTTTSSAPATSSTGPAFAPFSCPAYALFTDGQALYSHVPGTSTSTQLETGFGLQAGQFVDAAGYNVQDNFLYATIINSNVVIRISANNKYQVVATIPAPTYNLWGAGEVDNNNQYWIFSGNSQYMQIDTTLNAVVSSGTVSAPTYISDWVYLSGGGNYLWTVNIVNGVVAVMRFSMTTKTFAVTQSYGLLTGNTATNFAGLYAISSTMFEAYDQTTNQVWRFDINNAVAPSQQPSLSTANQSRDGARCITNL